MATEDWVTLEEAAQKLHVALDTMRRWVRLGHFPRARIGKRYLIPLKALDDFLQGRLEHGPRPVTPRRASLTEKPGDEKPVPKAKGAKRVKPGKKKKI